MAGNENSGNPNPKQTDEFKEARAATQFGAENGNPRSQDLPGSNAPWSSRNESRWILAQEFDPQDKNALEDVLTDGGKRKPTGAKMVAAALFKQAVDGNVRACEAIMENAEGKLVLPVKQEGDKPPPVPPVINLIVSGEKWAGNEVPTDAAAKG